MSQLCASVLSFRVACVNKTFCALVCLQNLMQEVKQLKNKVEELEGQKNQYERKLRATKVHRTRGPLAPSLMKHQNKNRFCFAISVKKVQHSSSSSLVNIL